MTDTIRIKQNQLEQSAVPHSVVVSDINNEQTFLAPCTPGQVLSVGTTGLEFTTLTPTSGGVFTQQYFNTPPSITAIAPTFSQVLTNWSASYAHASFNSTTGVFTAPTSAEYLVNFNTAINTITGGTQARVGFKVNCSNLTTMSLNTVITRDLVNVFYSGGFVSMSKVFKLNAGDTLVVSSSIEAPTSLTSVGLMSGSGTVLTIKQL